MSLLTEAYEKLTVLNKTLQPDGYGGVITTYTDGPTIEGALILDSSAEQTIAQALGTSQAYTLTVRKDIELDYHTVIRRESDGSVFRLTSNTDDKKTPESATLNMRQYTAERWQIP